MNASRQWHDLLAVLALGTLAVLAFPLLGSFANDTIEQRRVQPTAVPTRVYLLPFRQVFAVGAGEPLTTTQVLLYENGTDVFQMIGKQGAFARLQTLDASLDFWTLRDNVVFTPPVAAQYDFSARGKTARLDSQRGMACLHRDGATPPLSACQSPAALTSATLTARIMTEGAEFYLVQVAERNYFITPDVLLDAR